MASFFARGFNQNVRRYQKSAGKCRKIEENTGISSSWDAQGCCEEINQKTAVDMQKICENQGRRRNSTCANLKQLPVVEHVWLAIPGPRAARRTACCVPRGSAMVMFYTSRCVPSHLSDQSFVLLELARFRMK